MLKWLIYANSQTTFQISNAQLPMVFIRFQVYFSAAYVNFSNGLWQKFFTFSITGACSGNYYVCVGGTASLTVWDLTTINYRFSWKHKNSKFLCWINDLQRDAPELRFLTLSLKDASHQIKLHVQVQMAQWLLKLSFFWCETKEHN